MGSVLREDDDWLLDAQVTYRITQKNSRWLVELVFTDTNDPNHILVRRIKDYRSKRLAEISAEYMKQTAARDARGTQTVNKNVRNINNN